MTTTSTTYILSVPNVWETTFSNLQAIIKPKGKQNFINMMLQNTSKYKMMMQVESRSNGIKNLHIKRSSTL